MKGNFGSVPPRYLSQIDVPLASGIESVMAWMDSVAIRHDWANDYGGEVDQSGFNWQRYIGGVDASERFVPQTTEPFNLTGYPTNVRGFWEQFKPKIEYMGRRLGVDWSGDNKYVGAHNVFDKWTANNYNTSLESDGDYRLFESGLKFGKWTDDAFLSPIPRRGAGEVESDLFRGFKTVHRYTSGELVSIGRNITVQENSVANFRGVDGPPNLGNPTQVVGSSGYILAWDTFIDYLLQNSNYTFEYVWVYETEYSGEFTRPEATLPFKERYDTLIKTSGNSGSSDTYQAASINRSVGHGLTIAGDEIPFGLFEYISHPRGVASDKKYVNSWTAPNVILDHTLTIDFYKMYYDFSDGRYFYHPIGLHGVTSKSGFPFGGNLQPNASTRTFKDKSYSLTSVSSGSWDFYIGHEHTEEENPDYQSYSDVVMKKYFESGYCPLKLTVNNSRSPRTIIENNVFSDAFTTKINLSGNNVYYIGLVIAPEPATTYPSSFPIEHKISGDKWFSSVTHRYGYAAPQTSLAGSSPDFYGITAGGAAGTWIKWDPDYADGSGNFGESTPRPLESGDYYGNLSHPFNGRVSHTTVQDPYIYYGDIQTLYLLSPFLTVGEDGEISAGNRFKVGVAGAENIQSDYTLFPSSQLPFFKT